MAPTNKAEWPGDWLKWISVEALAQAEDTTPRQVYYLLDSGMPHSRYRDRIRVRRCDFHQWHLANMRNAKAVQP